MAFGKKTRADWKNIIISYDNMCHLNNLKIAKKPLPLPGDLQHIWLDVKKIIDSLHISNHKDKTCAAKYHPANALSEQGEQFNTMSCEQTFAWLSRLATDSITGTSYINLCRYKKILCAMPKTHYHFYLHRQVSRRNDYISWCYSVGRKPLQPKLRNKS